MANNMKAQLMKESDDHYSFRTISKYLQEPTLKFTLNEKSSIGIERMGRTNK